MAAAPHRRPAPRAVELLLTSEAISAERAREIGIVSYVCGDDAVLCAAAAAASALSERPAHALGAARRLVREGWTRTLADHLDVEAATIARASAHPETGRLIAAFLR